MALSGEIKSSRVKRRKNVKDDHSQNNNQVNHSMKILRYNNVRKRGAESFIKDVQSLKSK